jgi:hypothetical protein
MPNKKRGRHKLPIDVCKLYRGAFRMRRELWVFLHDEITKNGTNLNVELEKCIENTIITKKSYVVKH